MASACEWEAALVLHGGRRLTTPDRRWAVGPMERPRDRRADQVLHDDHHQAQRLRCRSPRPDAGVVDRRPIPAMAETLKPAPNDYLQRRPVSKRVNSSKADANDATLIERLELA